MKRQEEEAKKQKNAYIGKSKSKGAIPKAPAVGAQQNIAKKPNLKPFDADLVSAMEKRLVNVEGLTKSQKAEIKKKTEKLGELQDELKKYKKDVLPEKITKYTKLQKENREIQTENAQIKNFMKEYGYNWDEKTGEFNLEELKENMDIRGPAYRNDLPKEIDLGVIIKRVQELNTIAEIDSKKLVEKGGVHQMGINEALEINFYKNGLMIQGYEFHPYYSREAQGVLSDLLDGYFPYDLKEKYPMGVPLKVIDKTDQKYEARPKATQENTKKQEPEKIEKSDRNIKPENAQIMPEAKKEKNPGPAGSIEIETEASKNPGQEEICNLRIRTEGGKNYLIMQMFAKDSIKQVYNYIKSYRYFQDLLSS